MYWVLVEDLRETATSFHSDSKFHFPRLFHLVGACSVKSVYCTLALVFPRSQVYRRRVRPPALVRRGELQTQEGSVPGPEEAGTEHVGLASEANENVQTLTEVGESHTQYLVDPFRDLALTG